MARGPGLLNPFLLSKSLPRRGKKNSKTLFNGETIPLLLASVSVDVFVRERILSRPEARREKRGKTRERILCCPPRPGRDPSNVSDRLFFFLPFPLPRPHRNPCVASSSGPASCRSSPLPLPPSARTRLGEVFPRRFFKRAIVNGGTKQSRDNTVEIFSRLDLII